MSLFAKQLPRSNAAGRPGTSAPSPSRPTAGPAAPASGVARATWSGSLFRPPSVKPTTSGVLRFCVPTGLAGLGQWIVWTKVPRNGQTVKLPISAKTLRAASSTDPKTWTTLRVAQLALAAATDLAGLGFVFAVGGELFGVDLDECIDDAGRVAPWAAAILAAMPTYAELSPSGRGIKLYGIGRHETTGATAWMGDATPGRKRPRVEVYGWGRYFAFTGRQWPGSPAELGDCRAPLAALVASLKPKPAPLRPRSMFAAPSATRAARYLGRVPPSQCGRGECHNRVFFAACRLVSLFGLQADEAMPLLAEWTAKSTHVWTQQELEHKLADAERLTKGNQP